MHSDPVWLQWIEAHPGLSSWVQAVGSIAAIVATAIIARAGTREARAIGWKEERAKLVRLSSLASQISEAAASIYQGICELTNEGSWTQNYDAQLAHMPGKLAELKALLNQVAIAEPNFLWWGFLFHDYSEEIFATYLQNKDRLELLLVERPLFDIELQRVQNFANTLTNQVNVLLPQIGGYKLNLESPGDPWGRTRGEVVRDWAVSSWSRIKRILQLDFSKD
jgi:hypothetical protein